MEKSARMIILGVMVVERGLNWGPCPGWASAALVILSFSTVNTRWKAKKHPNWELRKLQVSKVKITSYIIHSPDGLSRRGSEREAWKILTWISKVHPLSCLSLSHAEWLTEACPLKRRRILYMWSWRTVVYVLWGSIDWAQLSGRELEDEIQRAKYMSHLHWQEKPRASHSSFALCPTVRAGFIPLLSLLLLCMYTSSLHTSSNHD